MTVMSAGNVFTPCAGVALPISLDEEKADSGASNDEPQIREMIRSGIKLPLLVGSRDRVDKTEWHSGGVILNGVIGEVNGFASAAPEMDDSEFLSEAALYCRLAARESNGAGYSNMALAVSVRFVMVNALLRRLAFASPERLAEYREVIELCRPSLDADRLQRIEIEEGRHGESIGTESLDGFSNEFMVVHDYLVLGVVGEMLSSSASLPVSKAEFIAAGEDAIASPRCNSVQSSSGTRD
ncbi:MAG: hypothetical protein ACC645_21090 [Pirellulales bacterium]